jgi:BirA family transcriptional regulator, biotin operon repressor / biotin---[acetyl-CoA-carboxylase] ligase
MKPCAQLIKLLKESNNHDLSGEELSEHLGISRSAVWKHIESLREAGFKIKATHQGYRLMQTPDRLTADEVESVLNTKIIGTKVLSYKSLDSTNRLAMDMGQKGYPEGLTVFSEEQTEGRGRLGRKWNSPKSKGLYFSILLRPKIGIEQIPRITIMTAVAVAQAIMKKSNIGIKIRWPNDLLIGHQKLCGILTEMNAETDRIRYLVIGIGINVNTPSRDLPPQGTSLKTATHRTWNRVDLAVSILEELERYYLQLLDGNFNNIMQEWEELSAVKNKRVTASTLEGKIEGTATTIDQGGALWIRLDSGIQTKILSGDVLLLR